MFTGGFFTAGPTEGWKKSGVIKPTRHCILYRISVKIQLRPLKNTKTKRGVLFMAMIKINEQIAFLRKQRGLTQEELAGALGVTNQAVSKWESAQCCPDIQLLPDIADYFGVSIDELIGHKASVQKQKTGVVIDSLIDNALIILKEQEQISISLLQKLLCIGYLEAKNLIGLLEEKGYIETYGKRKYVLKK